MNGGTSWGRPAPGNNMNKLTLIIAGISISVGVVMTVAVGRRFASQQCAQTEALNEQSAQIAQATAENARLSNLVARGTASQPLSPEQHTELLRLRNEVGQLRSLAGQKAVLEATNARLHEMAVKSETALSQARALPNYWPRDQVAFAGYGAPESTVRSFLAAMKNGDLDGFKDCFDPAQQTELEAELKKDGGDPAAKEAEIKAMWGEFIATADGFHIIDQTVTGSNEMTINLSFDGPGHVEKMVLRKIGNDWKFAKGP
jgi:hypothetical protein